MTDLVRTKAVEAFSIFASGVGVIHGDPDNSDERAQFPLVPADKVAELVRTGKVERLGKPAAASGGAPKRVARSRKSRKRPARPAAQAKAAAAPKTPPAPAAGDDAPPTD